MWNDLSKQMGITIPYLLERYLLLENWKYLDCHNAGEDHDFLHDISYLHLLLAEATTVLLSQEERIRVLENQIKQLADYCSVQFGK